MGDLHPLVGNCRAFEPARQQFLQEAGGNLATLLLLAEFISKIGRFAILNLLEHPGFRHAQRRVIMGADGARGWWGQPGQEQDKYA